VRITAKTDYALKACTHLASAAPGALVKADEIARAQNMPLEFLENILRELRRAGLVEAQRGADGGYRLSQPAATIAVADVVRAIDSPIVETNASADVEGVGTVWRALDGAVASVLEAVTLADVAAGIVADHPRSPAARAPGGP
jgi:Rrf2 family protein